MVLLYIEITDKYYIENKIAWYTDKFGARYSRNDILYIIKTGKLPRECYEYFGIRSDSNSELNYKVIINMSLVRGRLRCKNEIRSNKVYSTDKICVITEDSNSGYILVYNILNRGYANVRFDIIPAGGKDNISAHLDKYMTKYKYYVVIVDDKKSNYKLMSSIIERKRIFNKLGLSLSIFKPLSIEECLLSWSNLQLKSGMTSSIHNGLITYRNNGVKPYTYLSGDDYLYNGKKNKKLRVRNV